MFEPTSPFDDALAKPLLNEPVKKRWSLGTVLGSSKSSALSHSWGSSSSPTHPQNNHTIPAVPEYQASDHPDLEEIEFKSPYGYIDQELGLVLAPSPTSIGSEEAYDLDFAIIRERHQDITDINTALLQLNEIEKDLATVVDSQGTEIQDLETMAIESLDHASSGLSHILSMQAAKLQQSSKEHKHLYAAAIGIVLLVTAHWIFWSHFEAGNDDDMPDHHEDD